jgi:peroxiredoxin
VSPVRPALDAGRPGEPVDDIVRLDHTGRPWRLADQRGRPVLLIFHRHLH